MHLTVKTWPRGAEQFGIEQHKQYRKRDDQQKIVAGCGSHIAMQQTMNGTLRAASGTFQPRKPQKRTFGKELHVRRVEKEIDAGNPYKHCPANNPPTHDACTDHHPTASYTYDRIPINAGNSAVVATNRI